MGAAGETSVSKEVQKDTHDEVANLHEEDAEQQGEDEEGAEGEDEEDEEAVGEEDEDTDFHYVPEKSLLELEKMHASGTATKDAILALISDEHEESLPDAEVMVPVKLEGYVEHLPSILDHLEP